MKVGVVLAGAVKRLGDTLAGAVDRRYTVDSRSLGLESAGTRHRAALYRLVAEGE